LTRIKSTISFKFDFSFLLALLFSLTGFIILSGASDCDMHRTDPGSVHQASVPVDECCEKMAVDTSKKQNPDDCSEGSICCYAQDLNTVADSAVQTVKETDCIITTEILSVIPVISRAELVSASYILVFENLPIYLVNSSFLN
jgi:hypothetical protein